MKYKVLILFGLLFGGHCLNLYRNSKLTVPEVKTYEIKDEVTGKTYLLRKIPKLKKSVMYCHKRKENVVVWVDWHIHQDYDGHIFLHPHNQQSLNKFEQVH